MTEYGIEQKMGPAFFQGRQSVMTSPGKNSQEIRDHVDSWKLTVPTKTPLPDWAVKSARLSIFDDCAKWGYGQLPTWVATSPTSGLFAEKCQSPNAAKPVDRYTVQASYMVKKNTFVQASYESNPLKADDKSKTDDVRRSFIHVGVAVKPSVQVFSRLLYQENRVDDSQQHTISFGIAGTLSPAQRLQLQFDSQTRSLHDVALSGNSMSLEYERKVASDDYLTLKMQMNPKEFSADENRMHVEAAFNHTF
jgi:hypothetical protein